MKARPDAITFKQLRAFREVVDRGSLTAAAEVLGLSVPAVHAQLQSLRGFAGTEVLARGPDGRWAPTAEGEVMLATARAVQTALDVAMQRIASLRSGRQGRVALGVVSTAKYFAPYLVARLMRQFPTIDIELKVGNRGEIFAALAEGRLDLAITGWPPREPAVEAATLGPHPHVIVAAPGHPLAAGGNGDPAALVEETFLSREEGSGTRSLMIRFLDRVAEGRTIRTIEMGTNETIKQAVMAGLGIALISQHAVIEELRQGRLVALELEGLPIVRQWFLIHVAGQPLLPAADKVARAIVAMEGSFLPVLG
ncbi:MAG TPA: LysR family transcriptional regulator [Amaricoccus sp.]|uniref:LysR family transcriptional regulator n=1 Tax=Amaricoccus sp. TaxID=1872485 RepID=UPI002B8CB789|nr:LysR family transcriptional regulator [Amaricoccus sp.]HRO09966.1 LysR family transcriptional regulator [Amaricoccus sp.]